MSRKASNFQKVVMSWGYRGKEIFKPLNTGWIDDAYHVSKNIYDDVLTQGSIFSKTYIRFFWSGTVGMSPPFHLVMSY